MFVKSVPIPGLVLMTLVSVAVSADNPNLDLNYYCAESFRCNGNITNIMCNTELKFASNCVDAEYVPITEELKELIVDAHNKFRNEQALGKTGYIFDKTAADMATMSWDEELELMSLANALKCEMVQYDNCRNTAKFKMVGQNIYREHTRPFARPIKIVIDEAIQEWYDECKYVTNLQEVERLGSSGVAFNKISHWAQLVQSKANRIGCSAVRFTGQEIRARATYMVCSYSAGSRFIDFPIFSFGPPASLCKTGENPNYPGLCSTDEDFSQHENGAIYFDNDAPESPVVNQWLENGKTLDLQL